MTTEEKNEPVKKKRGPKKKDTLTVSPPAPEATPVPQERDATGRFVKGNSVSSNGKNSLRAESYKFRRKCHAILDTDIFLESFLTMLTLAANEGKYNEYIALMTYLSDRAYGKPTESKYYDEPVDTNNTLNNAVIVVSKDDIINTLQNDKDYE